MENAWKTHAKGRNKKEAQNYKAITLINALYKGYAAVILQNTGGGDRKRLYYPTFKQNLRKEEYYGNL